MDAKCKGNEDPFLEEQIRGSGLWLERSCLCKRIPTVKASAFGLVTRAYSITRWKVVMILFFFSPNIFLCKYLEVVE